MKNKLTDLNNHLFAQMERLSEEDMDKEKLETELSRAKAVSGIAKDIISNAQLALDAKKHVEQDMLPKNKTLPAMIK